MELQGKIIAVLPERSGVSARGEWKVQEFVLETMDSQYPRKMVFDVFGAERLQRFNIQIGQTVLVAFDIDAHEYNGRWFNSIRAFDVRQVDASQISSAGVDAPQSVPMSAPNAAVSVTAPESVDDNSDSPDNLPF
jgi:tyrosine-protein phosphatase YwqE